MRKLYNTTKGKIHPSPPPPPPSSSTVPHHQLSLLPLAIATLAATLPPEDQEVLAYLLTISATTSTTITSSGGRPANKSAGDHPPQFSCNCFRCYTSFWVRWDSSPNRKVIHEIIDVYEDGLISNKKGSKSRKERKNKCSSSSSSRRTAIGLHAPPAAAVRCTQEPVRIDQRKIEGEDEMGMGSSGKGAARKIVNFIGERIWGVWGV